MKQLIVFAVVLAAGGCASVPDPIRDDFRYVDLKEKSKVGVRAYSRATGTSFEANGYCDEGASRYGIKNSGMPASGAPEESWSPKLEGVPFPEGEKIYSDAQSFLIGLSSLEVTRDRAPGQSLKVANMDMKRIVEKCNAAAQVTEKNRAAERGYAAAQARVEETEKETGLRPMPFSPYALDFNGLITQFRSNGVKAYINHFVWARDGDFYITNVNGKLLTLQSYSYAHLFMPIQIITDKQVLEGQQWSSVSNRPLRFMGVGSVSTIYGSQKQVLTFIEL